VGRDWRTEVDRRLAERSRRARRVGAQRTGQYRTKVKMLVNLATLMKRTDSEDTRLDQLDEFMSILRSLQGFINTVGIEKRIKTGSYDEVVRMLRQLLESATEGGSLEQD
jgi:hypothetical protein